MMLTTDMSFRTGNFEIPISRDLSICINEKLSCREALYNIFLPEFILGRNRDKFLNYKARFTNN